MCGAAAVSAPMQKRPNWFQFDHSLRSCFSPSLRVMDFARASAPPALAEARRPGFLIRVGERNLPENYRGDMTTCIVFGGASPSESLSMYTPWMTLPSLVPYTTLFVVSFSC